MDKVPEIIKILKEKVLLEVHITKNPSRNRVNSCLLSSDDLNFKVVLGEMLTHAFSNKSLIQYFKLVNDSNLKNTFIEQNSTLGSETDLEQIFNFYMSATFR